MTWYWPPLPQMVRRASLIHGEQHAWMVASVGHALAHQTSGADPRIAILFGVLHDSQRVSEGSDPDHGRRAAAVIANLDLGLSPAQRHLLMVACAEHTAGYPSRDDPTLGVCWDADRLDLWRLGIVPDPALLSTAVGIDHAAAPLTPTLPAWELLEGASCCTALTPLPGGRSLKGRDTLHNRQVRGHVALLPRSGTTPKRRVLWRSRRPGPPATPAKPVHPDGATP